ncbi:MAG: serine acetyltransferase [bacterium]|nr:serine acetyltransferase [bacterium]
MEELNEFQLNRVYEEHLNNVVEDLCKEESYKSVYHSSNHDIPMPSLSEIMDVIELLRSVLFPGYFGPSEVKPQTMKFYIGSTLDRLFLALSEQIKRGDCFACGNYSNKQEFVSCTDCEMRARKSTLLFLQRIPHIRSMLAKDVEAAFEGDPAAKQPGETIFCYPSLRALTNHRIAHELFLLGVQLIPRIVSELSHSETGIDIHPGATIGESFFIDHGTGVVIGETSIIGKNVRIYQGVTLGAKSFPLDKDGNPIKGIMRHPLVEDGVVIYSGATILGRVTIGKGAEIGGNVWITYDVPPGTKVSQSRARQSSFEEGAGI